jgi:hypothetical protein
MWRRFLYMYNAHVFFVKGFSIWNDSICVMKCSYLRSSHTVCCDCIWEEFEENQSGNQKPCYSKVRQYNGHKKKVKWTHNDMQYITQKTRHPATKKPNQNMFVHTQEKNNKTSLSYYKTCPRTKTCLVYK